jgi:hypothetical protein
MSADGEEPLIADVCKQYRESCWSGNRLAVGHPRKLVEPCYDNRAIIDDLRSSLLNFVPVAAPSQLQVCKRTASRPSEIIGLLVPRRVAFGA